MRIGVDTGGTFTDCVVLESGKIKILKVFSTPGNAGDAMLEGVRRLVSGRPRGALDIIHGTTVGTNSLLERRGARVALVTTAGFEDLIEIARQARPKLYDLNVERDPPLVSRSLRWGVRERTAAGGTLLLRPTLTALRRLREEVKRSGAESIALCFLFSFANPANERAVARALQGLGVPISVSHEILPEFREYERLSTVVINAYLAPRMGAYLAQLEGALRDSLYGPPASSNTGPRKHPRGMKHLPDASPGGRIFVMQSSGGIATAARGAREPVRTILSGPAGGVVAASWLRERLKTQRVISFDMGGTSTDVCLIEGRPRTTSETALAGLPVAVPVLDVHSVGAGGGSIARIDAGGALRVGPESAGAEPGPVCYRRGGTRPTVTDANLLLGRLDPDYFLGGTFKLDSREVERTFVEFFRSLRTQSEARRAGFKTPLDLAQGIVAVANATMEKALRVISVERGYDPREFSLISFGGAGGLHAADLARSLRLDRVIVPQNPGAFSALGVLLSDIVKDVSQSLLLPVPQAERFARSQQSTRHPASDSGFQGSFFHDLERQFERLEQAGRKELRKDKFAAEDAKAERRLDIRYVGQAYELSVPCAADFRTQFHRAHEKTYGYAHLGQPLEIVNLRLRLIIRTAKPRVQRPRAKASFESGRALLEKKEVWFGGRFRPTAFYERTRLEPGTRLAGPAIVAEYSSTTVVPPDFVCHVDEYRNLVLSERGR